MYSKTFPKKQTNILNLYEALPCALFFDSNKTAGGRLFSVNKGVVLSRDEIKKIASGFLITVEAGFLL